jgi:UDP-GlcNAc:undecaprenyl-phosphate GlcNAc-1-phosphate transferase
VSVDTLVTIARAATLGSLAVVTFLLFAYRFEGFSRVVFVLDWLLFLVLLSASRISFRLFHQLLPAGRTRRGRRVLIYGAGDAGDLLARELLNNPALDCVPVGFVDDDPRKKGKVVRGLRVLGGIESLREACSGRSVEEVLISSSRFSPERVDEIARDCESLGVGLKRMRIEIEQLTSGRGELAGANKPGLLTPSPL